MSTKIKLLYIDDEKMNLELFEYNFKKKYEVITDSSALKGLIYLEKNPDIKVVISDMKMPNMNGLEFIARAKKIYKNKKYFILTGYDITPEIKEAIEKRLIINYFRKPFNMLDIETAINENL